MRYSAADFAVVQQVIEDATKRSFASLATDSVLLPLDMTHSAFEQPPGDAFARHAATGHDSTGKSLPGKWRLYPELASAGLWSTPSDLAHLVTEIQEASGGRAGKVLTTEGARQVLDAQHVGWPGLGVWLEGRDASARFRTTGQTEGFTTAVVGYVERGKGAVVMVNTAGGEALIEEILNAIAAAYGWSGFVPPEKVIAKVDPKMYDRFVGRYAVDNRELSVAKKGNRLFVGPAGKETLEIFPENVSDFFSPEPAVFYSFVFDETGKVQAVTQKQRDESVRWDRKK
jgi:CubicO group peptidase (beta-lactamase class C family)